MSCHAAPQANREIPKKMNNHRFRSDLAQEAFTRTLFILSHNKVTLEEGLSVHGSVNWFVRLSIRPLVTLLGLLGVTCGRVSGLVLRCVLASLQEALPAHWLVHWSVDWSVRNAFVNFDEITRFRESECNEQCLVSLKCNLAASHLYKRSCRSIGRLLRPFHWSVSTALVKISEK